MQPSGVNHFAIGVLSVLLCIAQAYAQETPALTLPSAVNSYESFEVQLSGPGGPGDMLRFADASGAILGGSYAYVGNAKNSVLKLTAPFEPGDYAVVYLREREVVGSYPLTVNAVSATLQAASSVDANGHLEVTFTGPLNNGDYLQFTDTSGTPLRGLYAYVGAAKGNTLQLRAPAEAGTYAVAYFTGKKPIGSVPVKVTGVQAQVSVPDEVVAGAQFLAQWKGPNNRGDLLRVRDASGADTGSYSYPGNNPQQLTLRAPEQPGRYQVVYLTGGKVIGSTFFDVRDAQAELQAPVEVAGAERFDVRWQGPGNRGDMLLLVDPKKDGNLAYGYIDATRGDTVTLLAPRVSGDYQLRYHTHGGRTLASRALRVTPPVREPGTLLVEAVAQAALGPDDAVEVVLDASGSMLQRLAGERRIEIARRTLQALVAETIPPGTPFALRVFGHREADSCRTDLEIPLAPLKRDAASAAIASVQAMNLAKTPIAASLASTQSDLSGVTGERVIVLLTDGEETCDGDPAEVIAAMRAAGDNVRVSIVGLAIDDIELENTFARWAKLGGGEYFPVSAEADLAAALVSAVNPVFTVYEDQGRKLAEGVAGGEAVLLMPGSYAVEVAGSRYAVKVEPSTVTRLRLD